MHTLTNYLGNEAAEGRGRAIASQMERELCPSGTLEIFFAAEIVRALLGLENAAAFTESSRARITAEIRRNTAELRRLRADRLKPRGGSIAPEQGGAPVENCFSSVELKPAPKDPTRRAESDRSAAESAQPIRPELRNLLARNGPCPCNSGQKYKRCCGRDAPPVPGDWLRSSTPAS